MQVNPRVTLRMLLDSFMSFRTKVMSFSEKGYSERF